MKRQHAQICRFCFVILGSFFILMQDQVSPHNLNLEMLRMTCSSMINFNHDPSLGVRVVAIYFYFDGPKNHHSLFLVLHEKALLVNRNTQPHVHRVTRSILDVKVGFWSLCSSSSDQVPIGVIESLLIEGTYEAPHTITTRGLFQAMQVFVEFAHIIRVCIISQHLGFLHIDCFF